MIPINHPPRRPDPRAPSNPARIARALLPALAAALQWSACQSSAAALPDWEHRQDLAGLQPGLVKLALPPEWLHAARPDLGDLRILSPTGEELPYLIDRSTSTGRRNWISPATVQVQVAAASTQIRATRAGTNRARLLRIDTPATDFVKSVTVLQSVPGAPPRVLATNALIFRQPSGAARLIVELAESRGAEFEINLDDRRSPPIPVTGLAILEVESDPLPGLPVSAVIVERSESPGESRLTIDLGSANLNIDSVSLVTPERLFTRTVRIHQRYVADNELRDRTLTTATVYRLALDDATQPSAMLSCPVDRLVTTRELELVIDNGDSPPLPIDSIQVERRPIFVVFAPKQSGTHQVFAGSPRAPVPRYDIASLAPRLRDLPVSSLVLSPPAPNPDYKPSETLPAIPLVGAALDISPWTHRRRLTPHTPGIQQFEVDVAILARANPDLSDLRFIRDGNQVPYIIERNTIWRSLTPQVATESDPKRPSLSRWILQLPEPGLPIARLACESQTVLFQRSLRLFEKSEGPRGETVLRELGTASWQNAPGRASSRFTLDLTDRPTSNRLYLETDNLDNAPLRLDRFALAYRTSRVLLKTADTLPIELYYGNRAASAPSYDLALVADRILAAPKSAPSLGAEETLKAAGWAPGSLGGTRGTILLWTILIVVAGGLLVVITKLLPKAHSEEPHPPNTTR